MVASEKALKQFLPLLPELRDEEVALLENLPEEFNLQVEYTSQQKMWWSGAAVAQMLHKFHKGIDVPQDVIAHEQGLEDWRGLNHESLKEDFARHMARHNFLPAVYYPGRYVLPRFKSGVAGADFIATNYEMVNDVGFRYFRALMVATKSPVMIRVHFHTGIYPMPEEMAQVIDTSGHALLLIGFNRDGFIVHDPWDKDAWGGTGGGAAQFLSYEELASRPSVNCCLGMVTSFMPFKADFDYPRSAIHQDRDIDLVLRLNLPGVRGITSDVYALSNVSAKLTVGGELVTKTEREVSEVRRLVAGDYTELRWKVNTGSKTGSYPVEAIVRASLQLPAFGWESNALTEVITLTAKAQRRLDVKDLAWLNAYGR